MSTVIKSDDPPEDIGGDVNEFDPIQLFTIEGKPSGGAGGGGGGTVEIQHPFQIYDTSVSAGTARFVVRYGTVNDVMPTGVTVTQTPTDASTNYVQIELTLDAAGAITDTALVVNTTQQVDGDYVAYILLGTVVVTGSTTEAVITAINQAVTHSLRFRTCDRVEDPFEVGEYYFWGV